MSYTANTEWPSWKVDGSLFRDWVFSSIFGMAHSCLGQRSSSLIFRCIILCSNRAKSVHHIVITVCQKPWYMVRGTNYSLDVWLYWSPKHIREYLIGLYIEKCLVNEVLIHINASSGRRGRALGGSSDTLWYRLLLLTCVAIHAPYSGSRPPCPLFVQLAPCSDTTAAAAWGPEARCSRTHQWKMMRKKNKKKKRHLLLIRAQESAPTRRS